MVEKMFSVEWKSEDWRVMKVEIAKKMIQVKIDEHEDGVQWHI